MTPTQYLYNLDARRTATYVYSCQADEGRWICKGEVLTDAQIEAKYPTNPLKVVAVSALKSKGLNSDRTKAWMED